jgi:hypothetical protein
VGQTKQDEQRAEGRGGSPGAPRQARLLEVSLLATFLCHGAAMVMMALVLAPMLPGGGTVDDGERVRAIGAHPWLFRLGWLPWHLTALSDLALAVGLLRTPWVPRAPAWASLVLTVAAVVPDQLGQFLMVTRGVSLAEQALAGDLGAYGAFFAHETAVFPLTTAWAALLYTLGAIVWSWCFWSGGAWSRALTRLSIPLWGSFLLIATGPLLPASSRPSPDLVAAGNAACFIGLEAWLWLVTEQVLRRARPDAPHGRWAPWKHPRTASGTAPGSLASGPMSALANSRFARALCEWLPVLEFRSDIVDVIYVNYLAPAERLAPFVPEGLELQRLGPDGAWAMFSTLTYRHGHFGPSILGPLRRLFPSPIQTNWRTYVRDPRTGKDGIYFVTTAVTTSLHALGARLMTEGVSMHMPARASLSRAADGAVALALDPGQGSAPDLDLALRPAPDRSLPPSWSACFADYDAMLLHALPQDRALSTQPWRETTTRQEISLGIQPKVCEPLEGKVSSRAARAIVGDEAAASPVCFRVPRVDFVMTAEEHDRWG